MNEMMKNLQEKRERVAKTIRREETDRVPFLLIADTYAPYYCGVELSEITTYEKATEINKKFFEDIQFDALVYPFSPQTLALAPKLEILGGGCHVVKDYIKQINPEAVKIMEPEDYTELIKDPVNYLLETVYPRRFKLLRSDNQEEKFIGILNILKCMQELGSYIQSYEENGIPLLLNQVAFFNPVDVIFDVLRNFTGMMRDIRRSPDLVRDAGLAMVDGYKSMVSMLKPVSHGAITIPMHMPPFIKPKDFEKVYWPSFKVLAEALVEQGHNICFFFEKKYEHLYDYLQELPNKGIIGVFEEDDIRVVKKKLGNTMAVAGGLSSNLMQYGTKEQCIDHVKGLIDDLGPGGGYFITNDMPLLFSVDAQPQNLKAVADYINKQ